MGALGFMIRHLSRLRERVHETHKVIARYKVRRDHLERDVAEAADSGVNKEELRALRATNDDLELLRAEQKVEADHLRTLVWEMFGVLVLCTIVAFVGVGLSRWGFKRWHTELQIPLDRAVQRELTDSISPTPRP